MEKWRPGLRPRRNGRPGKTVCGPNENEWCSCQDHREKNLVLVRELAEKPDNMFDLPGAEVLSTNMCGAQATFWASWGVKVVEDGAREVRHLDRCNRHRMHARFPVAK